MPYPLVTTLLLAAIAVALMLPLAGVIVAGVALLLQLGLDVSAALTRAPETDHLGRRIE
jgi:hypothetical protein